MRIRSTLKGLSMPMMASAFIMFTGLGLTSCGGGGGAAAAAPTTVAGQAAKGPYQVAGSTVQVFQLVNGVRGATAVANGTILDATGRYSVDIPAGTAGPFEIVVTGSYLDEVTGALSAAPQPTSLVVTDAATAAAGNVNMNPITTIQTELVKAKLIAEAAAIAAAPAGTTVATVPLADTIASSGTQALQALGVNTVDAAGKIIDPAALSILAPADPVIGAQLLSASALVADMVNQGAIADVSVFAQNVATDLQAGRSPGAAGSTTAGAGVTSAIMATSTTNIQAPGLNLATNLNTALGSAGSAVTTTITATQATTATTAQSNPAIVNGYVLGGGFDANWAAIPANSFSIGAVRFNVAQDGTATQAVAAATTTAANMKMEFVLSHCTGVFGGAANSCSSNKLGQAGSSQGMINVVLSASDGRRLSGTIGPVTVTTTQVFDGLAGYNTMNAMTLNQGATFTFIGNTAAGVQITGAPQVAASLITMPTRVGRRNNQTFNLDTNALFALANIPVKAGTYAFEFSMPGLKLGFANLIPGWNKANTINNLYPSIKGTFVVQ